MSLCFMEKDNGSVNPRGTRVSDEEAAAVIDSAMLHSLQWRLIGPFRGGRVVAVAGDPVHTQVFYFGSTGGGIWKTTDGGIIWENVSDGFFKRASVGAIAVSTSDPNVIYAGMGESTIRGNVSHGDGVYKSTDGGKTWTHLGLADTRQIGKVRIHPQNPDLVYVAALGHAHGANNERGVYRSHDGGKTWERLCEEPDLRRRPWYYQHIHADPQDAETVWVLNVRCYKSIDGGRTFARFAVQHGDVHDLWIDPRNPQRMILGDDGGAAVTFNGGETWSSLYNQPTCEFYHVTTDNQVPYRVYGAQQDNSTISVPSRSRLAAITQGDYIEIGGGESGYIAVRPDDANIIYAGSYLGYLTRYDHRSGQLRDITVWPEYATGWAAKDVKYRFQWTFPILLSPHDPNVLYVTGNHAFRSI